jgi:hypothetical protein
MKLPDFNQGGTRTFYSFLQQSREGGQRKKYRASEKADVCFSAFLTAGVQFYLSPVN